MFGLWVLGLNNIPSMAVDAPDIYWTTDFVRSYEETAYFGEVSYDITDANMVSRVYSTHRFTVLTVPCSFLLMIFCFRCLCSVRSVVM